MSDISFTTAPIGGGKTLWTTIELCRELGASERFINTNVPMCLELSAHEIAISEERLGRKIADHELSDWDFLSSKVMVRDKTTGTPKQVDLFDHIPLQAWCDKWSDRPIDITKRLAILTKEQIVEHYLWMPKADITPEQAEHFKLVYAEWDTGHGMCGGWKLPTKPDSVAAGGVSPDLSSRHRVTGCFKHGVVQAVDEAHTIYYARNYQKVSALLETYQSQLRKFDDDCFLVSQHPGKVDKNCKRNATQWRHVANMGRGNLLMGVGIKGKFRWALYDQPEEPSRFEKPTSAGWYSIDPKFQYHKLYYTMDGVGVSGGLTAEVTRRKVRGPWIWVVAALALLGGFAAMPYVLQTGFETAIGHVAKGADAGISKSVAQTIIQGQMPGPQQVQTNEHATPQARPSSPAPPVERGPQVYCKGWSKVPGKGTDADEIYVFLSDGTIAKGSRGEVEAYGENWVKILGRGLIPVKVQPTYSQRLPTNPI